MTASVDLVAREILDVVPVIMRTIRMEMRSRRGADLSVVQFRALLFLNRNPGASLSTVAGHLGLTLPTVSKMVDRMVADRWVTRGDSTTDRRRITLVLTAQGQSLLATARRGTQHRLAGILGRLTPAECESVHRSVRLLQGLFSAADTRPQEPE
jgi:MarR family transcriptional regulator for hemolysin